MGIYDRDYYREEQRPGVTLRAPRSMVVILILINVAAWVADAVLTPEEVQPDGHRSLGAITQTLALQNDTLQQPWLWWKFLTNGFAHAPQIGHILFNMLGLWFLGRYVEQRYGRWEFLSIYLVMIVLGSLVWAITSAVFEPGQKYVLLGASGAVSGVVILFILNFPRTTLILFPIPIPIKAWLLGVLLVVYNLFGALGGPQVEQMGQTAFSVHLVGMAFAFMYFSGNWNLSRLFGRFSLAALKPKPRLRVHHPPEEDGSLEKELDRILAKIHAQGESSLTRKERRTLEAASREYRKRR